MKARKVIKIYSSIITKNIPLFLAVGFLNILFSESGWFPNPAMGRLADDLYGMVIPVLLGYYAGKYPGRQVGGLSGAIGAVGLVSAGVLSAMTGALIVGFVIGYATDRFYQKLEILLPAGFEMMGKNLTISLFGIVAAGISYFVVAPFMQVFDYGVIWALDWLVTKGLLPAISLFIEPLKIFFLNNCINHGILIPFGMEQLQTMGKSVLFLMETNPGPGLGILLAIFWRRKEERKETAAAMGIHALGGIHEVYLPYVFSNLRLLLAVTLGGLAGSAWFVWSQVGLKGPASPGSILTIFLMSGVGDMVGILVGIGLSTAVSFGCAWCLLGVRDGQEREDVEQGRFIEEGSVRRIYVVCDAGLGSSAMGAALLRRCLRQEQVMGIEVLAAASDDIPSDADLLVCQRDFYLQGTLLGLTTPVCQVERLTKMEEYGTLVNKLKGRMTK